MTIRQLHLPLAAAWAVTGAFVGLGTSDFNGPVLLTIPGLLMIMGLTYKAGLRREMGAGVIGFALWPLTRARLAFEGPACPVDAGVYDCAPSEVAPWVWLGITLIVLVAGTLVLSGAVRTHARTAATA